MVGTYPYGRYSWRYLWGIGSLAEGLTTGNYISTMICGDRSLCNHESTSPFMKKLGFSGNGYLCAKNALFLFRKPDVSENSRPHFCLIRQPSPKKDVFYIISGLVQQTVQIVVRYALTI